MLKSGSSKTFKKQSFAPALAQVESEKTSTLTEQHRVQFNVEESAAEIRMTPMTKKESITDIAKKSAADLTIEISQTEAQTDINLELIDTESLSVLIQLLAIVTQESVSVQSLFIDCSFVQTFHSADGLHTLKVAKTNDFFGLLKQRGVATPERVSNLVSLLEPYPSSEVVLIERLERVLQMMQTNEEFMDKVKSELEL